MSQAFLEDCGYEGGDKLFLCFTRIESIGKTTVASELAQKACDLMEQTLKEMVPKKYLDFWKVFSEEDANRFPLKRPWDHAIDLAPDAPATIDCKVYPLTQDENQALTNFLNEHLEKGYIQPSKSPYSSPFFFIKKKDRKLCPVQDYHHINQYTVWNNYPLPLILELINKVRNAALFTKFNIQWGYNNICIKEGDEWIQNQSRAIWTTCHVLWSHQLPQYLPDHDEHHTLRFDTHRRCCWLPRRHPHSNPWWWSTTQEKNLASTWSTERTWPLLETGEMCLWSPLHWIPRGHTRKGTGLHV